MRSDSSIPNDLFHYNIGITSRLTGLSTANLRAWEKRYNAAEPTRSQSGHRQYSGADVQKLTLLKNLSDRGHPIRTTASLSIEQLEEMLLSAKSRNGSVTIARSDSGAANGCRVVIVGERISQLIGSGDKGLSGTTAIAQFKDLQAAESQEVEGSADLLIVECPALFDDVVDRVQRLIDQTQALRAIVIFHFAQAATVKRLQKGIERITAIRAPVSTDELRIACAADVALANRAAHEVPDKAPEIREKTSGIPDRKFSEVELAKISQVSSAIDCECPHHLASLLSSLLGFEKYSAECKSRNEADAKMHAYLHSTTAHARAIIEDALEVLVEFEGIELESQPSA